MTDPLGWYFPTIPPSKSAIEVPKLAALLLLLHSYPIASCIRGSIELVRLPLTSTFTEASPWTPGNS
ncbi:MAG: hypothetical protein J7641_17995 [Cyanobacteria bacterium SID2]|nr:hypothetical protein [Cyanobacteria bacterium SID2]MBP0006338.1 hypothetical protein [Cyanobacteria bacterium SBC]